MNFECIFPWLKHWFRSLTWTTAVNVWFWSPIKMTPSFIPPKTSCIVVIHVCNSLVQLYMYIIIRAANNFPAGASQIVRSNLFLLGHIPFLAGQTSITSYRYKSAPSPLHMMFKYETSKLRLNSQGNCGADRVCWFKYKNVIEQSVMGSNYASVERLSPRRQWLPTGEMIVVRRAMSESEAFWTRHEVPREKSSL